MSTKLKQCWTNDLLQIVPLHFSDRSPDLCSLVNHTLILLFNFVVEHF